MKPQAAKPDPLKCPAGLSAESKTLWSRVVPSRARSEPRLAMLEVALLALDRLRQINSELAQTGLVSRSKRSGLERVSPLLSAERKARADFVKCWRQLGLDWDPLVDGRF